MSPANGQINRRIDHLGPFGIVHAQEKDIAPAAVRKIHADRRPLAQDRITVRLRIDPQQLRANLQRKIGRMSGAEHPLITSDRTNTATDLVCQSLERQPVIGLAQRTGE